MNQINRPVILRHFGSNPPQIAIVMKHAFFNVKFGGE